MTKPNEPILSVRELKTIRDSRVIHDGVNLDLYAGEVLVLLGESGSGKTLLLRTLVGLETPDAGTCLFEGRDLFKIAHNEWPKVRLKIAYAFQGGALFDSLTVRENLEFPLREHTRMTAKERQNRVALQLDELGLGRIEDLYPAELSGGMQKRIGVARAIILDPQVILFDEPTAGLDPENVRRCNEMILRLKGLGKSAMVVTHDPSCALVIADRFAFLADGHVAVEQQRSAFEEGPDPNLRAYFSGADCNHRTHERGQHL